MFMLFTLIGLLVLTTIGYFAAAYLNAEARYTRYDAERKTRTGRFQNGRMY